MSSFLLFLCASAFFLLELTFFLCLASRSFHGLQAGRILHQSFVGHLFLLLDGQEWVLANLGGRVTCRIGILKGDEATSRFILIRLTGSCS